MNLVLGSPTISDIHRSLVTLPKSLDQYLDSTWERLTTYPDPRDTEYVTIVLGWLRSAQQPLEWEEIRRGLYLYHNDGFPTTLKELEIDMISIADIIALFAGLLADPAKSADGSVIDYFATVDFIHTSVRQYFELRRDQLFPEGKDVISTLIAKGIHVEMEHEMLVLRRWKDRTTGLPYHFFRSTHEAYEKLLIASCASIHTAAETLLISNVGTALCGFNSGLRPLHCALNPRAEVFDVRMLTLLVENRSNLELGDINGNTPLHYGAISVVPHNFGDRFLAIRYLVERGARLTQVNKRGNQPHPDWRFERFALLETACYILSFDCFLRPPFDTSGLKESGSTSMVHDATCSCGTLLP